MAVGLYDTRTIEISQRYSVTSKNDVPKSQPDDVLGVITSASLARGHYYS